MRMFNNVNNPSVGISSTDDDVHYKITNISVVKATKNIIITYDD
ncbi:unnamed protein product [marine sediment metagenome]|uniref:Uncharacterized protein n=1 Tax=marine sediment metagenome TaxID=412755 RepID=X1FK77_9ZZZZ